MGRRYCRNCLQRVDSIVRLARALCGLLLISCAANAQTDANLLDTRVEQTRSPEMVRAETALESSSSLERVTQYAIAANPSIQAAERRWRAAQARVDQKNAYQNPIVSYVPDTQSLAETRAGQNGNGIEISQAIPFPGKLTLRGRVADSLAAASYEQFRRAIQEVSRQARARYADYFLADFSLAINRSTTRLAHEFADIAAAKYRVGTAAQQDVILAEERLSRLAAERIVFAGQHEASIGAINTLLDRASRASLGPPVALAARNLSVSLDTLLAAANDNRPELRGQDRRIDARRHSLRLAKMSYIPDFVFSGKYIDVKGGSNPGFSRDGRDVYMLKLGFSVPLWFNRVRAENAEARAQLAQERAHRRDLFNRVSDEIQRSYESVRTASRTEEIYRTTLIPQTRERIAAATSGYQTSEVDFLTLIDSLDSLEEVELEQARSIRNYHRAVADLERAVGSSLAELAP